MLIQQSSWGLWEIQLVPELPLPGWQSKDTMLNFAALDFLTGHWGRTEAVLQTRGFFSPFWWSNMQLASICSQLLSSCPLDYLCRLGISVSSAASLCHLLIAALYHSSLLPVLINIFQDSHLPTPTACNLRRALRYVTSSQNNLVFHWHCTKVEG